MLDFEEINNTIEELENGATTFDNCMKLASLYTVREYGNCTSDETSKELHDILPMYSMYCTIKRKYQMRELSQDAVIRSVQDVCQEIKEFIN